MTRSARIGLAAIAAFAFLGIAAFGPAAAQDMAPGTWGGTLTGPGGESIDVTFEVTGEGEDLAIMLMWPDDAPPEAVDLALEEIELSDGALNFVIPIPEVLVACELEGVDEGAYEGECAGSDGQSGHLRMTPPA